MNGLLFPDSEAILIASLRQGLNNITPTYEAVHIGVQKRNVQLSQPSRQITVRSDGGPTVSKVFRDEGFGVNIYVQGYGDDTYREASLLARHVEAVIREITNLTHYFKNVTVETSPTRILTNTEEEQRYFTFSSLVKADNFNPTPTI